MPEQIVKEENLAENEEVDTLEENLQEEQKFDFSKRNKLNTKPIPAITTLSAGAVVSVATFFNRIPVVKSLELILISMIIFLIIGDILKFIADRFIIESEEEIPADGEVIEKTPEEAQEAEA